MKPTISIKYHGKWVPFDSVPETEQQRVRKRVGEILTEAIKQEIEIYLTRNRDVKGKEDLKVTQKGVV